MYSEREEGNLAEQPEVNGRLNGLPVYGRPQTQQLALAQLATLVGTWGLAGWDTGHLDK